METIKIETEQEVSSLELIIEQMSFEMERKINQALFNSIVKYYLAHGKHVAIEFVIKSFLKGDFKIQKKEEKRGETIYSILDPKLHKRFRKLLLIIMHEKGMEFKYIYNK
jgi:hypothetical protein